MSTKHRIMLVEDHPADALLVREALEGSPSVDSLEVSMDGTSALALLKQRAARGEELPDLVLLDLRLPGISGQELLAALKQDSSLRRIPVIILTTSASEEDVRRAYELHANSYLQKPMDLDAFTGLMHSVEDFWLEQATLPPGGSH